jgi:adenosine deaminase
MATEMEMTRQVTETITAMPKAELHVHLDGCVRRSLVEYLALFATPLSVLQTAEALERVTYELCEDLHAERIRYAEIRFAPALHTERGLSLDDVIAAVVRGWTAGRRDFSLRGGILLCAMRHLTPEENMAVALAGLKYLGNGVVGFDIAGDEANFPVLLHREPLLFARDAGYGMTIHAGEAAGPRSVRDAVEEIGATRIGHGVRSGEDPSLLPLLRDRHITLELCPTSNLQTHAVRSLRGYPLMHYYRFGIPVTINTDSRTVSNTTVTGELQLSGSELGLPVTDLARMTLMAVEAGFDDSVVRRELVAAMRQEMVDLGINPPG